MAHTDIVFDGPPSHDAGCFVEVEDAAGKSISFGEWIFRPDGYWALRIPASPSEIAAAPDLLAACKAQHEAIDRLFAMLIDLSAQRGATFLPSKSGKPWDAIVSGSAAIAKAEVA